MTMDFVIEPIDDDLWVSKDLYGSAVMNKCKMEQVSESDKLNKIICSLP